MKIYTVEINQKDYRKLEFVNNCGPTLDLAVSHEVISGKSKPPVCRFIDVDKPKADFMSLCPDQIVFDPIQLDAGFTPDERGENSIYTLAEMASYGLAGCVMTPENQRYHLLAVTECCNALNMKESQWQTDEHGQPTFIDKFVFHGGRVDTVSGLFRLADPDFDTKYIFAYTARDDEEHNFIDRYFQYNKTGLVLTEVWSD